MLTISKVTEVATASEYATKDIFLILQNRNCCRITEKNEPLDFSIFAIYKLTNFHLYQSLAMFHG